MVALDPTTRAAARRGAPGAGVVARPGAGGACAGAAGVRGAAAEAARGKPTVIDRTAASRGVMMPSGSGGAARARDHEEQVVGTVN